MRQKFLGISGFCFFLSVLIFSAAAQGQCPDVVDQVLTFPLDGSNSIPTNVVLRAEFPESQDPHGEPYWYVISNGVRVNGVSNWDGSTSTFTPHGGLDERTAYTARVTAQATGDFWSFTFATGSTTDTVAPSFSGITEIEWAEIPEDWLLSNCRLAQGNGFVFKLMLGGITDEGTGSDPCFYVYQTKGPNITEETLVARMRPIEGNRHIVYMEPVEDGEGEFCFRVNARDLGGNFDGNSRVECVEAVHGAIFADACSIANSNNSNHTEHGNLIFGLLLIGAFCVMRRFRFRKSVL